MNTVEPIRNAEKLTEIQETLERDTTEHGRRKYLLFCTGIYTGLRVSDMIGLQVKHCNGDYIVLKEQKTGKQTRIYINPVLRQIYRNRLADMAEDDFLFPSMRKSRDGREKHITRRDAYNDLKQVYSDFGLRGMLGCHTLRKTFGYYHYQTNKDLQCLRRHFNHSSCEVTRRYIGLTQQEQDKEISRVDMGYRPSERRTGTSVTHRGQGIPAPVNRRMKRKE